MITPQEAEKTSIPFFLFNHEIKSESGSVLDFKKHPFLLDIYRDVTPFQAVRKAAQVGFSTLAIIKSLWLAKQKGLQIIYTLPSAHDVQEFVGSKIDPIINQNPIFQEWVENKDTVSQKKVGDGFVHFRGTVSERSTISITADLLCIDEIDRSDLKNVEQYDSRLQHSAYKWKWHFSNPSVPNVGVDKAWQISDQKHYMYRCSGCSRDQYLTMENVKPQGILCTHCGKEIERTSAGRWVQKYQNRDVSGYWISLLMCPWVSAADILKMQKTKSPDYFDNFVLGQPHIGTGNVVTRDTITRNLVDEANDMSGQIVIGVDTGVEICVVASNNQGIFYYDKVHAYDELEYLLKRWPKSIMVIDQGGDIIGPRQLKDKYPGRVFLCFFRQDRKTEGIITWGKGSESWTVIADRNKLMQLVIDELTDRRWPIFGREEDYEDYIEHWLHIYRASIEDKVLQRMRDVWMRTDRDDFVLATCYCRIGMDRFLNEEGALISKDEKIGDWGYESIGGRAFVPIIGSQYRQQSITS